MKAKKYFIILLFLACLITIFVVFNRFFVPIECQLMGEWNEESKECSFELSSYGEADVLWCKLNLGTIHSRGTEPDCECIPSFWCAF